MTVLDFTTADAAAEAFVEAIKHPYTWKETNSYDAVKCGWEVDTEENGFLLSTGKFLMHLTLDAHLPRATDTGNDCGSIMLSFRFNEGDGEMTIPLSTTATGMIPDYVEAELSVWHFKEGTSGGRVVSILGAVAWEAAAICGFRYAP